MNKFNVKTPNEWKENLFLNIKNPKRKINYKAVVAIAAVAAVLICSTTGFAYSQAPEYFGSMLFSHSQENIDSIYSSKNIVFESPSDEFSLTCIGIAGDRNRMFTVFELKSNGDFCFEPDETYFIGEWGVETLPLNLNGYSIGSSSTFVDEKTVLLDVFFNSETINIIGGILTLELKDIVVGFGEDEETLIPGEFRGRIRIDYPNTVINFAKTKSIADSEGVSIIGKKAWISNLGFSLEFKVTESTEFFESLQDNEIVFEKMTLNYDNGTSEDFNLRLPSRTENDVRIGSVSINGNSICYKGKFPRLINSSEISSVAFDDCVMFVK